MLFCKCPTINISKLNFWLEICIAKNFIWTTLMVIFSIFRFFCTLKFQNFKLSYHNKPYINWKLIYSAFIWCIYLNFKQLLWLVLWSRVSHTHTHTHTHTYIYIYAALVSIRDVFKRKKDLTDPKPNKHTYTYFKNKLKYKYVHIYMYSLLDSFTQSDLQKPYRWRIKHKRFSLRRKDCSENTRTEMKVRNS